MVFRHSANDFLLTAAEPNLGYLSDLIGRLDVTIEDVTDEFGMLAVQGPRSRSILAKLAPEVEELGYFEHTDAKIGGAPVTISRTGYTGDLGYEVRVRAGRRARRPRRGDRGRRGSRPAAVRRGGAPDDPDRGRPGPHQRRVLLEPVRLHRPRPHHPQGARVRLDAQGHRRRRPSVHRSQRDPPRARRQDVAMGHRRARRRLGRLRPGLQRGRPHPTQGRDPARLRVDAVRRRRRADRLRDEPDVLPHAAAPHRDGAGPTGARRLRDAREPRAHHQPPLRVGGGRRHPAAVLQPPRKTA